MPFRMFDHDKEKINDRVYFTGAILEDNQQLSISSPCGYKLYSL